MKHDRELLLGDEYILRLMNNLSGNILRECNNDLMKGWHRLIQYCAMLHDEGTIKIDDRDDVRETARLEARLEEIEEQMYDSDAGKSLLRDLKTEAEKVSRLLRKLDAKKNITREEKQESVMRGD